MRPINGMFSYRFRHNIKTSFGEYLPLLKNSAFTRLLTAGFISAMGSKITYFALLRKVYVISGGSILDLGFLTMASMLPAVIIGPFAGILIDNLPRKKVMIAADVLSGLTILLMIPAQNLNYIFTITFISALFTAFRMPAQQAMEPNLVKKDQIVLLNSFKTLNTNLVIVIGSAVGALLVGFVGVTNAFIIDSATYFISAALTATIMLSETHINKEDRPSGETTRLFLLRQFKEYGDGIKIAWVKPQLRSVILIQVFISLAMGMQGILIYYFLIQTLNLGSQAEKVWGLLLSALGVGGIIGGMILGVIVKRSRNRFRLFLDVLLFDAVTFSAFLYCRYLPLSYLLFSLSGAIGAAFNIIVFSILQEEVADKNRGKIFALLGIINGPLATLSVFIGTTGAQYLTARVILLLSAAFEVVISFGLRLTKTYRQSNTPEIPPAA